MKSKNATRTLMMTAGAMILAAFLVSTTTMYAQSSVDTIVIPPRLDTNRTFFSGGEDLQWSSVGGAESYHIQVSGDPEFTSGTIDITEERGVPMAELIRDVTNIRDTRYTIDIDTGGYYYWRVRAVDEFFVPGPWSTVGAFQLSVSSVATTEDSRVSAGPNPCISCTYRVRSATDQISHLTLYDLSGRQVLTHDVEGGTSEVSLDLSVLSSGMYHVLITLVDGSVVGERVVVE